MADMKRFAGIALFFAAFILLLVASVSVPSFRPVDIVHTTGPFQGATEEVRYGIWGACRTISQDSAEITICQDLGHGYSTSATENNGFVFVVSVGKFAGVESSWTKGLATHPVATAIVFVAFATSIFVSNHLITILIGAAGALVALIAIAIDIAFNVLTRHAVDKITDSASTSFGPGFYLTLVGFVATVAGVVLLFIHRREDASWDSDSGSISLNFLKKPLARFKN